MTAVYAMLITFVITAILGPVIIPVLHRLKAGQSIREIGPKWHEKKSGTPTMGGITFIIPSIVISLIFCTNLKMLCIVISALMFGIIGFIDDYIKVVLKRNLGLTAKQKFIMQVIASAIGVLALKYSGFADGYVYIPFLKYAVDLSWFYIIFCIFVITATVNSVNLTDGLDGLAATVTVIVLLFFTGAAIYFQNNSECMLFCASLIGGLIGFLIYNYHPAKMFMGDTGSLFLGGAVSVVAITLKLPVFIIIVGAIYLIETLSVMIQVTSFKLTGKRVFKMSPLHHHFEMCGYTEAKIVALFSAATFVCLIIATIALLMIIV